MKSLQKIEVSVFKMTDGRVEQHAWNRMGKGVKNACREVLNTSITSRKNKIVECYVFAYCDSEEEFTALCMVRQSEAVFYLKESAG